MNLVLADAAVIAGGFAGSLGQALASPWMLAVPGALLMLGLSWLAGRRSRRVPLVLLPPLADGATEPCPWCDDPACIDSSLCDCAAACGRYHCKGAAGA